MTDTNPEVTEAIRIANKHLDGESADRRRALAHDIAQAMIRHAGTIAADAISRAFAAARKQHN